MKLKKTKQEVFDLPYAGIGHAPWPVDYRRVLVPQQCKNGDKAVVQIVHKSALVD